MCATKKAGEEVDKLQECLELRKEEKQENNMHNTSVY